jgi:organic radical activating enzyme
MTTNYQVNEMFNTVQGEGVHVGKAATFIRLQGCSVGCPWCDTKYTWLKGGTRMTAQDIMKTLGPTILQHVVITGGEPTLYNLDDLLISLRTHLDRKYAGRGIIQLETSGQNLLKGGLVPDWVTWSPKENLHFSAETKFMQQVHEIKFVVDASLTYEIVKLTVQKFLVATHRIVPVILMPEGTPPKPENCEKAFEWVMKDNLLILGDRLQWRLGIR